jgi:hypothetical protein
MTHTLKDKIEKAAEEYCSDESGAMSTHEYSAFIAGATQFYQQGV